MEGQSILLRGVVDRVDRNPNGGLRIIDYKTGSSHLSRQDLVLGRRLQLPIYALAAERALGLGKVEEGFYWSLLRGEAGALKLSSFKDGEDVGLPAASAVVLEHVARIVDGIRQAQFPPLPPKGGCPSYCPVSAWCWRYAPEWGA
jgi:RecB family exonuclease